MQDISKILYDRALGYLNVDISVAGHDHIRIGSTPLLYSAIYTATKMVRHFDQYINILANVINRHNI